jgi:F420-non-reducing hydrogenase small subunit
MCTKPTLAIYWAAACGGCEIAVVNLHEDLLVLDAMYDFVFCPCLMDTKKVDVERMADASIDLVLFNGAIRTEENEDMARLLRRKAKTLVAFGACACDGGIPALSNLSTREAHLRTIYREGPMLDNPTGLVPQERTQVPEGTLRLPAFHERVRSLRQVVEVDYFTPGCPPESHQIKTVLRLLSRREGRPPRGSVVGGGRSTVCRECTRERHDPRLERVNPSAIVLSEGAQCLLEQGGACLGIVTRDGCGARCPRVGVGCIGCYGAADGVTDVGGKMVSALGSMLDIAAARDGHDIDDRLDGCDDLAGAFYKFTLASSLLGAALENRT